MGSDYEFGFGRVMMGEQLIPVLKSALESLASLVFVKPEPSS